MSQEEVFEQKMRMSKLFDLYGGLLTAKQHQCLSFYFYDDLNLSEIADELGVSRQAVHDLLKRVEKTLEQYESKLNLLAKNDEEKQLLHRCRELLTTGEANGKAEALTILYKLTEIK